MMTSCLAPVPPPTSAMRMLKRVRSASLAAVTDQPLDTLKACKREAASPARLACDVVVTSSFAEMEMRDATMVDVDVDTSKADVPWPRVEGCEGLRNAILFLQNSKQHAMLLMMQNHWDRAMSVLEKVEKATESVCTQRRKLVLEQANQIREMLVLDATTSGGMPQDKRAVRFCDDVQVVPIEEMDRSSWEVQSPVREEMLVLRASRAIPKENMSELWQ